MNAYIGLVPFILSTVLVLGFLLAYKAIRDRRKRRSPLAEKQIANVPGQQLVARISDHESELLLAVTLMLVALPMMFMAWAGQRLDWSKVEFGGNEWLYLVAAAVVFAYGLRRFAHHLNAGEQARDGLIAERVTGIQLNRLLAKGCVVLHDLPCGNFNIDHVIIAPRGIYAVETKSFRKPKGPSKGKPAKVEFDGETLKFSDFSTRKPIDQARRQAKFLSDFLRESLGETFRVDPALSIPGWWIDKIEAGKSSDVFVFTPMGRGCEWFTYGDEAIPATKRNLIAQALATKYPAIA